MDNNSKNKKKTKLKKIKKKESIKFSYKNKKFFLNQ